MPRESAGVSADVYRRSRMQRERIIKAVSYTHIENKEASKMEKQIQISGLSKSYDGKKVIENLSFSVAAGEVLSLIHI